MRLKVLKLYVRWGLGEKSLSFDLFTIFSPSNFIIGVLLPASHVRFVWEQLRSG